MSYVTKIARLLQFIGTCDADLSKGNLRMDVNVSVAREATISESLGVRCEVKNLNSLERMRDAIQYEIERHIAMMEKDEPIISETLGWDVQKKKTFSLRTKETVVDYRFMRDGDLPCLLISKEYIQSIQDTLVETPSERIERYAQQFKLPLVDCEAVALDPALSKFFEEVVDKRRDAQIAYNWIIHELTGLLKGVGILNIEQSPVSSQQLGSILDKIEDGSISGKIGKQVLKYMFDQNDPSLTCSMITKEKGWEILRDEKALNEIAVEVVKNGQKEAISYKEGDDNRKQRMMKYFMGQSMKLSKGKADPELMKLVIMKELNKN